VSNKSKNIDLSIKTADNHASHNYEREIMIPRFQLFGSLYLNYQWNTLTTAQEGLTPPRPVPMTQGRLLGGGSSLNVMVWGRGTRTEHDHWKTTFENPGWGWDDLFPYFKKVRMPWSAV
jgi:choline dehydrogenase-like flavoprotein